MFNQFGVVTKTIFPPKKKLHNLDLWRGEVAV
jgi:hypothetical protein